MRRHSNSHRQQINDANTPPTDEKSDGTKLALTFVLDDGVYRLVRELSDARLLMQKNETGREVTVTEDWLTDALTGGTVIARLMGVNAKGKAPAHRSESQVDPDMSEKELLRARTFLFYVLRYDDEPWIGRGKVGLQRFINMLKPVAHQKGLTHSVKPARLLAAIDECGFPGRRVLSQFVSQRGKTSRLRQPPEIEALLAETVHFYWDLRGRDFNDAYEFFFTELTMLNRERDKSGLAKYPVPKRLETIRRRIRKAECHLTWSAKYGPAMADRRFNGVADSLKATRPGELVIIDHTKIDAFVLLDEASGLPLGRLTLTVAIDVATRCIMAFLLSAEPPSLYSVQTILMRINKKKSYVQKRWPDIEFLWDSWCRPETLLVDNGLEFVSNSFEDAVRDTGTDITWAPIHNPQYKAIGERFFHTLNTTLFHKMPGAVPSHTADMRKAGLNPSKDRLVTFDVMDELLHRAVLQYENTTHSGVNAKPARLWREGLKKHPRKYIRNISLLHTLAGNSAMATLGNSGIRFENMDFHDAVVVGQLLNDMVRLQPVKQQSRKIYHTAKIRVKIKYNPADCSQISVFYRGDGYSGYVTLKNRDERFSEGMSFWHAREIYKYAKSQDLAFGTEEQRLFAKRQLREIYEKFARKGFGIDSRKAQRLLAQAVPTLEDGDIEEWTHDDDGELYREGVPVSAPGLTRTDADKPTAGYSPKSRKKPERKKVVEIGRPDNPHGDEVSPSKQGHEISGDELLSRFKKRAVKK